MGRKLGFSPDVIWDDSELDAIREKDEVVNMPAYPDDGSIKVIDDIVVVKFE